MMNQQTITKLNQMKLFGMANGFAERITTAKHVDLSHEEFVGLLVDDEKSHRENSKMQRLLKKAGLKQTAALEDVDFKHSRGLEKQLVVELSSGTWLTRHLNVLITGPTGVGKSFLACALGNQACRNGFSTAYYRFSRLSESLLATKGDGTYLKFLYRLEKANLLILDDFALSPLSSAETKDFLEIVEGRYGYASTILTSQLPVKDWHQILSEPTLADAICDRLLHNAFRIELKGESMRKRPNHGK